MLVKLLELDEYAELVKAPKGLKLQEIQDYVEENYDTALWDYPMEELEHAMDVCEALLIVKTDFGIRICEYEGSWEKLLN